MAKTIFPAQQHGISQKTRTAMIGQGQRMANWLYNIAQLDGVPSGLRVEARLLCDGWDSIRRDERTERIKKAKRKQPHARPNSRKSE